MNRMRIASIALSQRSDTGQACAVSRGNGPRKRWETDGSLQVKLRPRGCSFRGTKDKLGLRGESRWGKEEKGRGRSQKKCRCIYTVQVLVIPGRHRPTDVRARFVLFCLDSESTDALIHCEI